MGSLSPVPRKFLSCRMPGDWHCQSAQTQIETMNVSYDCNGMWDRATSNLEARRCASADDLADRGSGIAEPVGKRAAEIIAIPCVQDMNLVADCHLKRSADDNAAFLHVVGQDMPPETYSSGEGRLTGLALK
jgi:hypothetical protein